MQCHVSLGGLLRQCNNKCELRIKQAQTGFISGEQPRLGRVPKGSSEIRSESAELVFLWCNSHDMGWPVQLIAVFFQCRLTLLISTSLQCPLFGESDGALHILSG
eukprot:scaffold322982_cov15-Tisochrysis_lutea.AAC.1